MHKIIRVTTVPLSLTILLTGQMKFMHEHEFEVIMVSSEGVEWEKLVLNEVPNYYKISLAKKINLINDLKALIQLTKIIRKEKPDIVHSHTPKAGLIAMMAAYFGGCKIRLHTNSGTPLFTAKGKMYYLLYFFEKLSYMFATRVYANCQSMYSYLINKKLIRPEKLAIIGNGSSNGIDLARYSKASIDITKLSKIKKAINYNENIFYVTCIGRIVKSKGIFELLEAFKNISSKYENIKLLVIGSFDDDFEPVSTEIKNEILNSKNIIHIDWTNEVEYYLYLSSLLIHPSYREGFPNVLLQAGAMECPIICSNIMGNSDIVDDKNTGVLFKVNDTNDLTEKFFDAYNNYEQMIIYSKNLKKIIVENYDRKKVHQFILQEYNKLLKKQNG